MTSINDINYNNIAFSKQKTKSKNKFLSVFYDKKPFLVKLPCMKLAFGLQKNSYYEKTQYNFDLSFKDNKDIRTKFEKLDDFIIERVHLEHFQDLTLEEVKEKYVSCVKYPQNTQYSPTLKVKIVTQDNNIKCDMFYPEIDETTGKLKKIDIEEKGGEEFVLALLPKQKQVETVLECIGLWFMNDKFGLSFKALQVKVHPDEEKKKTFDFLSDSETSNSDADFLGE